jgi:hypothetical protein
VRLSKGRPHVTWLGSIVQNRLSNTLASGKGPEKNVKALREGYSSDFDTLVWLIMSKAKGVSFETNGFRFSEKSPLKSEKQPFIRLLLKKNTFPFVSPYSPSLQPNSLTLPPSLNSACASAHQ